MISGFTARLILLLVIGSICILVSQFAYAKMREECNRRSATEEYISEWFGYPGKVFRDISLYRKHCPGGRLHLVVLTPSFLALVCFIMLVTSKIIALARIGRNPPENYCTCLFR